MLPGCALGWPRGWGLQLPAQPAAPAQRGEVLKCVSPTVFFFSSFLGRREFLMDDMQSYIWSLLEVYCKGCRTASSTHGFTDMCQHTGDMSCGGPHLGDTPWDPAREQLTQSHSQGQRHPFRGDISPSPTPTFHPDPNKKPQTSFQQTALTQSDSKSQGLD